MKREDTIPAQIREENRKEQANPSRNDFRIIIAGGRDFNDTELMKKSVDPIVKYYIKRGREIIVVSGTANGADILGEVYAMDTGLMVKRFPADWKRYPRHAGHRRNKQMALYADALVAFWDGESRGTENMIKNAKKYGLLTKVIRYESKN